MPEVSDSGQQTEAVIRVVIGVARILSGVHSFSKKVDDLVLVVALKIAS